MADISRVQPQLDAQASLKNLTESIRLELYDPAEPAQTQKTLSAEIAQFEMVEALVGQSDNQFTPLAAYAEISARCAKTTEEILNPASTIELKLKRIRATAESVLESSFRLRLRGDAEHSKKDFTKIDEIRRLAQEELKKIGKLREDSQFLLAELQRETEVSVQNLRNAQKLVEVERSKLLTQAVEAETRRSESFGEKISALQTAVANSVSAIESSASERINRWLEESKGLTESSAAEVSAASSEAQERISAEVRKVEALVSIVAAGSMANDFAAHADKARSSGRRWLLAALVALGLLVLLSLRTYFEVSEIDSLSILIPKAFLAVSLVLFAAFSVRQADRAYDSETRNRRYQLELSAVDPYLAGLPSNTKNEVKVRLADKFFGNNDATSTARSDLPPSTIELTKALIEAIASTSKKN